MNSGKILVIEDDKVTAKVVEEAFRSAGFETIVAFDGEQGLDKARKEKPNLITLDIIMPKMDGWEILRQVRIGEDTKNIPVIIVSAKAEEESKIFALQQGADDYITKPFNPSELMVRAQVILRRMKRATAVHKPLLELGLLPVRSSDGFSLVDLTNVFHVDVKYGYACVHTFSEEFTTCFSLAELERRLDEDQFFRAHRGQIVNLRGIKEVKPITRGAYVLILRDKNETKVPVSRRRASVLRKLLGF